MREFIHKYLGRRVTDETGASAVEYGLLVAGIAALIVAVVFVLGGFIDGAFQATCEEIEGGGVVSTTGDAC